MIVLLALVLKLVGTGFLVVATIGVLRFSDPFQRMHAATKAGTLGAGLVLIGVMLSKGSTDATIVAFITLVVLIGTMPVAGHLLGRAAYISGAPLRSRHDALAGVLPRAAHPLEERLLLGFSSGEIADAGGEAPAPRVTRIPSEPAPRTEPFVPGYDGVRFAVIAPHAGVVARRAVELACARGATLTAVAVIDRACVEEARVPGARDIVRAKLARAIEEMRGETNECGRPLALVYEEGDPLSLIPLVSTEARELLVLPSDGWCHHGAGVTLPVFEERLADKLFHVAAKHDGPTLFAGGEPVTGERRRLVVLHDGSPRLQRLAGWAIATGLWAVDTVTVVGPASAEDVSALAAAAADHGASVTHVRQCKAPAGAALPARYADAAACIVPSLPDTASGYGAFWQDRLIPRWRGDVLV